jgi:hypothetical protein
MILGIHITDGTLESADDIEVDLTVNDVVKHFSLSEGNVIAGSHGEYYLRYSTNGWTPGIIKARYRTLKAGVYGDYYYEQIGFIQ